MAPNEKLAFNCFVAGYSCPETMFALLVKCSIKLLLKEKDDQMVDQRAIKDKKFM